MAREAQQDAFGQKLTAWVANSRVINPIITKAAQDGCLSQGTLQDLASAAGISLACTTAPVIVILPYPPIRNVKYHVPEKPPRMTRDGAGKVMFEGGEHTAIGDSAFLYFSKSDPGTPAYAVQLVLPNGLSLTYGQIVALGGDFYGIPDAPISDGATQADRVARFMNAYNSLATPGVAASEAPQILQVMQIEINAVNKALNAGQPASAAYKALGDTLSEKWNKITGGGSWISPWIPMGRYLLLSATNWDHFGQHAVLAYQAGHAAALAQALAAKNQPSNQQRQALSWAYAMDAFACHFLSDVFSAGHIRSPRKELNDTVTPSSLGGLLTRAMHDEDSHWGLNVTNTTANAWRAYGDKRYFDTVDLANKTLVDVAVQDSVDEVFGAFNTGTVPQPANYLALTRIANLTAAQNYSGAQAAGNISPLFAWNGSTTIRRNDVNNLNDYSWTSSWWGWSTWTLLQKYNPNTPTGYLQPPTGSPAVSPSGWQSNQSVPPNWVAGAQVRYAVSVVNNLYESDIGPWPPGGAFTTVAANQAYPTLTGVPVGPAGTVARRIYRQFINTPETYVGQIADNTTTTFIDTMR
jgi:hypothetical protein